MYKKYFLSLLCLVLVFGCGQTATQEIGPGQITNGVYSNEYLGFKIKIPSDMHLVSDALNKELESLGSDMLAGDNKKLKRELEASESLYVSLFSLFEREPGIDTETNASIVAVAEKVSKNYLLNRPQNLIIHVRFMRKKFLEFLLT